ncbi:MAG TPA: glycosyltransferase [Anaerolineales bacterium]
MHITIVAVGSRGDVQPYLALGLGLQKAGYQVQVCADRLFADLVASTGLQFAEVTAAPADMMQQNLSKYGGPLKLTGWLESHFKPLARAFFSDLEMQTRQTEAILYSTLAFAGYHVAEKHGIPALAVYNVPITPTHSFQNQSFPPAPTWLPFKGSYNWWSSRLANQLFIYLIKPIVNECRQDILGLRPLPASFYTRLDISHLPILYGFSPILLPRPADWGEWVNVTGQWFFDRSPSWQPPDELVSFLENGKPPVYVGFGSMIDEQIERATQIVLGALQRSGQRGILLGGWGGLGKGDLPETILRVEAIPHDWLFPRVAAVVHHGGSGTTATGLRFGKPTVVVPFFADQPFWGERVYRLGAGPRPIPFTRLSVDNLTRAIDIAVSNPTIRHNAEVLGERLQSEDGVGKAVSLIQTYLKSSQSGPH